MLRGILSTIPMFVCAFWFAALLTDFRGRNRSKKMLSLFMFSAFLLYLGHAIYFHREYEIYRHIDSLYTFCSLSVYPLYYLYIKSLTCRVMTLKDFWVLLPSFFVALFSFLLYQVMSDEESSAFARKVLFGEAVDYNFSIWGKLQFFRTRLFVVVFLIQVACVLKNGIRRIRIYHEQLSGFYSNMEKKELSKINVMLYFFVGISTMSVLFSIIGRIPFLKSDWLLLIPSLLFGSLLFAGGMIGFRQDFSVDDFAKDQDRDQKLETVAEGTAIFNESDIRLKILEENLIALMEDQQLFKQPDLKITDLSLRLGSNRSYVSRIINIQLNTTFSDFVGKYRIEHAKKMLLNFQRSVTMNEIAEQSGFPSESTFYRVFKQKMKISPKAWRQQQMTKCNGGNADEA